MKIIDQYPQAKAFKIKGKNEAVLMIHGFSSTANIFHELATHLHQQFGWEIEVPLLPGHGLTAEALDSVVAVDWIHSAELGMETLLMKYSKIHLVGLSLGGTLCAHLATRYTNNVASLTLLAPAMFIQGFLSRQLLKIARFLPSSILKKWIVYKKNPDITEHISYHQYSAYSVVEFDKVCRWVKKTFLTCQPTLIFVPLKDGTIHPKSSKWFQRRARKSKLIALTQSPHVVFLGKENEKIFSEIELFLKTT